MKRKILIMGLPGAGKTTLSQVLAPRLNAVHFNADEVRANINKDLGFSECADRAWPARIRGAICGRAASQYQPHLLRPGCRLSDRANRAERDARAGFCHRGAAPDGCEAFVAILVTGSRFGSGPGTLPVLEGFW
jgi:hypothetical protein